MGGKTSVTITLEISKSPTPGVRTPRACLDYLYTAKALYSLPGFSPAKQTNRVLHPDYATRTWHGGKIIIIIIKKNASCYRCITILRSAANVGRLQTWIQDRRVGVRLGRHRGKSQTPQCGTQGGGGIFRNVRQTTQRTNST